jgi:DNA-binding NtrC family response regulator
MPAAEIANQSDQFRYQPPGAGSGEPTFVGQSPGLHDALHLAERFARHAHITVLIEGESGTGKSYVAKYIHLRSERARGPFHQVILSALDDNLAASDLFGHLSGAYTDARQGRPGFFVAANKGTLFLDEIGKASNSVQRKLLHAIEHKEIRPVGGDRALRVDVRLVTATNLSLESLVERGVFLEDLAARLTNFRIRLPSLAERRRDIPALMHQFIALRSAAFGYTTRRPSIHPDLLQALQDAEWPYNLRQLDGVLQCLMMEADGADTLTLDHCVGELAYLREYAAKHRPVTPDIVRATMTETGSVASTARRLGISRWTVYRYLEKAREISMTAASD